MFHGNLIGIPRSIEHVRLGRDPRSNEQCLVQMVCRDSAIDSVSYDFDVIGDNGDVLMQVRGYGKVIIGKGAIG